MSYQVLARKWRPRNFASLVGQEHVVRALTHALEQQRLHHAYLFTGTRGVGKTTLARILAKSLNCETGITPTPCGKCSACLEIDAGRFVDLLEVDAATNTKVDEMRQLLENAVYSPNRGRFKVYVIDEVHMLSTSAFNAMLKTLEEPPDHVKFILATTDPQKIPVTVLSRCLQFNLKQMPAGAILTHLDRVLAEEKIASEPGALKLLAASAHGSMRDALSLLDQAIAYSSGDVTEESVRGMLGTVDDGFLFEILEAVARADASAVLRTAERMDSMAVSLDAALQDIASLLHQIALAQVNEGAIADSDVNKPRILSLAKTLDGEEIQLFYQIVIHGRQDLPMAPEPYAGFTMTLLRMLAFRPGGATRAESAGVAEASPVTPPGKATGARAADAAETLHRERAGVIKIDDWPELARTLKLGGIARQLAQQSAMVELADSHLRLKIGASQKHLAGAAYQNQLSVALEERFGTKIKVSVEIGATAGGSAQDKAVASISDDALVRGLMEQLDATIVESSIKPVR